MRASVALYLVAVLAGAGAGASGCAHESTFIVEPKSYVASGYYLGEENGIQVFLTDITYVGEQKGTIGIELRIINKRQDSIRVDLGANRLDLPDRSVMPHDTHTLAVTAGEVKDIVLFYRTDLDSSAIPRATLNLEGLTIPGAPAATKGPRYEVAIARRAEREDDDDGKK